MKNEVVVFLFIDALGWELVQRTNFMSEKLPFRRKIEMQFGYSSTAIPTILSGKTPDLDYDISYGNNDYTVNDCKSSVIYLQVQSRIRHHETGTDLYSRENEDRNSRIYKTQCDLSDLTEYRSHQNSPLKLIPTLSFLPGTEEL